MFRYGRAEHLQDRSGKSRYGRGWLFGRNVSKIKAQSARARVIIFLSMFDNLAGKDPEDIFSSTENLPQVAPPIKPGAPLVPSAPEASAPLASAPAPQVPSAPAAGHRGMPAALKVLLFFIAIAVVVGAAWAIARFLLSS